MPSKNPRPALPPSGDVRTEQAFSEDGVDLTLIRWMLSLSHARARTSQTRALAP
jgi:hypothetical protein